MNFTSVLAIYALIWVMAAFIVMPFGLRTHHDEGSEAVRGHADSAPVNFRPGRVVLRTTILATALMALYYANYVNGWITVHDINFVHPPKEIIAEQERLRNAGGQPAG